MRYRKPRVRYVTELLEERRLLCVLHEGGLLSTDPVALFPAAPVNGAAYDAKALESAPPLPAGVQFDTDAHGLPLLTERASGLKIFLDFDGYGVDTSFDIDGQPLTFGPQEQAYIYKAWRQVISFFAPFDVNVTTVQPPIGGKNPDFVWHHVSNNLRGGAASIGGINNSSSNGWSSKDTAISRYTGIAHEIGHQLGLQHQSEYGLYGDLAFEYTEGFGTRHQAIMGSDALSGNDPVGNIRRFQFGRDFTGMETLADEMSVITSTIISRLANTDGYRPDDVGNTTAAAVALSPSGTAAGIIERIDDADVFRFTSPAGGATFHLAATPTNESAAAPRLELLDSTGKVIAARDDADLRDGNNNAMEFDVPLPAGTYYVRVSGGGDYGEQGEYLVTAAPLPGAGFVSVEVGSPYRGGTSAYDPAANTFRQLAAGRDIWDTADGFRFTAAVLNGDGSVAARVDSLDDFFDASTSNQSHATAGVMIRQSLDPNAAFVYAGQNAAGQFEPIVRAAGGASAGTDIDTAGLTGPWVRVRRQGDVFSIDSSGDGTAWTTRYTTSVSMTGPVYVGLASCSRSKRNAGWSTFSDLRITGSIATSGAPAAATNPTLPVPTGLTAAPAAGANTAIQLRWNPAPGAVGYVIERSSNGINWAMVDVAGRTGTYTDADLYGSTRYFYRVSTLSLTATPILSAPSAPASAVNKPSAPTVPDPAYAVPAILPDTARALLNWADVQGDLGYRIEQSSDGGVTFKNIGVTTRNHNAFNVAGLFLGTTYVFRITPLTNLGDGKAPALLMNVTTVGAAPTGVAITEKTSHAFTLHWSDVPAETAYYIDESYDGTNWYFAGDVPANTTTWTETNLQPAGKYYFRVYGRFGDIDGVRSATVFAAAPPESPNLPPGWTAGDVGPVGGSGTVSVSNEDGRWMLLGSGADLADPQDEFFFASRHLLGNAEIIAKVDWVDDVNPLSRAGLMIRESTAPDSPFAFVSRTAENGLRVDSRPTRTSGVELNASAAGYSSVWFKLRRTQNIIQEFFSFDGEAWSSFGVQIINFPPAALYGLAVISSDDTRLAGAVFDKVGGDVMLPDDGQPPPPPVFTGITDDTGASATDAITTDSTITLTGTTEPRGVVTVSRVRHGLGGSGDSAPEFVGTAQANIDGNWSVDDKTFWGSDARLGYTAVAADINGRTSDASAQFQVVIDHTAPRVRIASLYQPAYAVQLQSVGGDDIASLRFVGISAYGGPNSYFPGTVDANGVAHFAVGALPDGHYEFLLGSSSDAAGNTRQIEGDFFVLRGDADGDGVIGPSDFNILATNFSKSNQTWAKGDFDGDGTVGPTDFNLLATRFGTRSATAWAQDSTGDDVLNAGGAGSTDPVMPTKRTIPKRSVPASPPVPPTITRRSNAR